VAREKKEDIKSLIPSNGCGDVTYTIQSGSTYASITGDEISFDKAIANATAKRTITIRASASQCGTKDCSIEVVIADKFAKIETCHNPRVPVGPSITAVEVTCVNDDSTPAKTFGCDCPSGNGNDWSTTNMFSLNGIKASGSGCWAIAPIPAADANKEIKRVLIEYNKEIGCVAY